MRCFYHWYLLPGWRLKIFFQTLRVPDDFKTKKEMCRGELEEHQWGSPLCGCVYRLCFWGIHFIEQGSWPRKPWISSSAVPWRANQLPTAACKSRGVGRVRWYSLMIFKQRGCRAWRCPSTFRKGLFPETGWEEHRTLLEKQTTAKKNKAR